MGSLTGLKKRLAAIEARALPRESWLLAQMPDGSEVEVTVAEYCEKLQGKRWRFKKMTRGFDPTYHDIDMLLSALEEECKE